MLVNYINYRFCFLFVRKITAFIWNMQVFSKKIYKFVNNDRILISIRTST